MIDDSSSSAKIAITALVPAAEGFPAGRDFAAWLGLTPLQKSTGGKQKLGAVSKRGERTIRRLLIIGASAVVQQASRRGAPKGSWLAIVACADVGSQAENAGHRRSGQQDGPHHLGPAGQRWHLQNSDRGGVGPTTIART